MSEMSSPSSNVAPSKWLSVSITPVDGELEVCVMDKRGLHVLAFPVRKSGMDWVDAVTKKRIDLAPTHWRPWRGNR
jgi:hypothetical protein